MYKAVRCVHFPSQKLKKGEKKGENKYVYKNGE
jgi:hypothetical protein